MWQIIGQEKASGSLQRSIAEGRLAHAYLFTGPQHVGKMTLALTFARALNCMAENKPCGECSTCRRIAGGNHPDIRVIQLLEDEDQASRKSISVEQIKEIHTSVSLKPYEGGYRVVIIDGAEFMSDGAANALLKTLEEPPPSTVILLLAVEESLLLSTIRSRCQKIELSPMPPGLLREVLVERHGIPFEQADLLSRISQGSIGWAISAIGDDQFLEEHSTTLDNLISLIHSDISTRFQFAADLAARFTRSRASVKAVLSIWLTWWRDLLMEKTGQSEFVVNIDRMDMIRHQASGWDVGVISRAIRSTQQAMQHLDQNANPRLAIEVMMLDIPALKEANYA